MINRNIAITGATGFLGKNLTLNLSKNGFNVRGFSRSEKRSFNRNSVLWFYGKLDDKKITSSFIENCETVIHIAGLTNESILKTDNFILKKFKSIYEKF